MGPFGPASLPPLRQALSDALARPPLSPEADARCRLALVQILHITRDTGQPGDAKDVRERCEALLDELPPQADAWPLTRYVRLLQRARFDRPADPVVFFSQVYDELSQGVRNAALTQFASQAAWRLSEELEETDREAAARYRTEAMALAQQALDQEAGDPLRSQQRAEVYVRLAEGARAQHRYLDARRAYEAATQADPSWAPTWEALGEFMASLGDREQALEHATLMNPHRADELRKQLERGEYRAATTTVERLEQLFAEAKALSLDPETIEQALQDLDRAETLVPDNAFAKELRFQILVGQWRWAEAKAAYAEIKDPPDDFASTYKFVLRKLAEQGE